MKRLSNLLFHKSLETILNSNRNFYHKLSIQEAILDLIISQPPSPTLISKSKTTLLTQLYLFNSNQQKCQSISMTLLRNVALMRRRLSLNCLKTIIRSQSRLTGCRFGVTPTLRFQSNHCGDLRQQQQSVLREGLKNKIRINVQLLLKLKVYQP